MAVVFVVQQNGKSGDGCAVQTRSAKPNIKAQPLGGVWYSRVIGREVKGSLVADCNFTTVWYSCDTFGMLPSRDGIAYPSPNSC